MKCVEGLARWVRLLLPLREHWLWCQPYCCVFVFVFPCVSTKNVRPIKNEFTKFGFNLIYLIVTCTLKNVKLH